MGGGDGFGGEVKLSVTGLAVGGCNGRESVQEELVCVVSCLK